MPTEYPQAIDVFQNPAPDTLEDAPGFEHDLAHGKLNDAVHALELKVGVDDSQDPDSIDARLRAVEASGGQITDNTETSLTGLIKGDGNSLGAAAAGQDYARGGSDGRGDLGLGESDSPEFAAVTVGAVRIKAGGQTWELSISGFGENGYPITDWKRIA